MDRQSIWSWRLERIKITNIANISQWLPPPKHKRKDLHIQLFVLFYQEWKSSKLIFTIASRFLHNSCAVKNLEKLFHVSLSCRVRFYVSRWHKSSLHVSLLKRQQPFKLSEVSDGESFLLRKTISFHPISESFTMKCLNFDVDE